MDNAVVRSLGPFDSRYESPINYLKIQKDVAQWFFFDYK